MLSRRAPSGPASGEWEPAPPPPELPSPSVLAWRRPGEARPRRQVPSHPLVCLAEADQPAPPRRRLASRLPGLLPAEIARRLRALQGSDPTSSGTRQTSLGRGARSGLATPLVALVAGGTGGSGRSTLALDIGWAVSAWDGGLRTLLVDADGVNPSLDLRLGAAEAQQDRLPSARVDQVLLRLPELAAGNPRLETLLWTHPKRSLRALLSAWPESQVSPIGPEHLDYLLQYLIRPAFDVVVVDGGPLHGTTSSQARFWAGQAHVFVLPLRPFEPDVRATSQSLQALERWFGVGRERCRGVVALAPGQSLQGLRHHPALEGLGLSARPWVQRSAILAEVRHLPLAEVDRKVAASTLDLVCDLWSTAPGGGAHG